MKTLLILAISCWAALPCHAAEIVAWKVPLSRFIGSGMETEGIARCESTPEASPFFKEGDELWDLKGITPDSEMARDLPLDWLIWDQSSGRLMAKGAWSEIYQIHDAITQVQLPNTCRITADVFEVLGDGGLVPEGSPPAASLSFFVRSGMKTNAKITTPGKMIDLETDGSINAASSDIGIRLAGTLTLPGQLPLQISTSFTAKDGIPIRVAKDFDGEKGLELRVTAKLEMFDGTPLAEMVMMQRADKMESLVAARKDFGPTKAGNGWVGMVGLPIAGFTGEPVESVDDPFADPPPKPRSKLAGPSINPPAFLSQWIHHELLDATAMVEKYASELVGKFEFAGYDPMKEQLFIYGEDKESVGIFLFYFSPMCNLPQPATLATTLTGMGNSLLIGKSGQKATMSRPIGNDVLMRSLEIEPTVGENGDILDLRVDFSDDSNSQRSVRINTSTILIAGKSKEIYCGSSEGTETRIHLKADIQRVADE